MPTPKQGYRDAQGNKLPGVTTILGSHKDCGGLVYSAWDLGKQGRDYQKEWKRAADIGTCVHARIQAHIEGVPFDFTEHDGAIVNLSDAPYGSYREWAGVRTWVGKCEVGLVHPLGFGGTLDYYEPGLILDWKTSKALYSEVWAQVAGYSMLIEHHYGKVPDARVVRFDKEGGPAEELEIMAGSPKALAGKALFLGLFEAYKAKRIIERK